MLSLALGPPLIAAFTMLLQRAGAWLVPGNCRIQQMCMCILSLEKHETCPSMLSAAVELRSHNSQRDQREALATRLCSADQVELRGLSLQVLWDSFWFCSCWRC